MATTYRTSSTTASPTTRFWANVSVSNTDDCWLWTGNLRNGYGRFSIKLQDIYAHRFSYELSKGPIPVGLTVDHTCHNSDPACKGGDDCFHRRCVNPKHLEAVTNAENILRGQSPTARNARQTACPSGHVYDAANTLVIRNGGRQCRQCNRVRTKRWRQERSNELRTLA